MKYQLELQRLKEFKAVNAKGTTEPSTIGELTLTSEIGEELFKGYTCENGGPSTDTSNQDKRIVAREYDLEFTDTNRNNTDKLGKWKKKALWLKTKELPSFANRRILIHIGNYPQDTLGCILVGKREGNNGTVSNSIETIIKLFNTIEKVGVSNVTLIIKEI